MRQKAMPRAAVMYTIAALCFLIAAVVGFVGDGGVSLAGGGFLALSVAFLILAFSAWKSGRGSHTSR